MKYQAGGFVYFYPAVGDEKPEAGAKVLLLSKGGVCIQGPWSDDFLAWAPLPKRNKEKEDEMSKTWNLG